MAECFNYTLATNNTQNNGNTAALMSGVAPSGAANLFPNVDIEAEGLKEAASTTTFVADKNVVSATKIMPSDVDVVSYNSSSDMTTQEIRNFLAKPFIVTSGNFTTTDTVSSFSRYISPYDLFSGNTAWTDKVRGFLGIRYTLVLRLVVNANRFQQGRYGLYYVPLGGASFSSSTHASTWISDHSCTLVQRTTLPHVELDLNCDTEAILRIPFNSALNYCPIYSSIQSLILGSLGSFSIFPYSPLSAVTGNVTCGYTLYAHLEDVQLVNAALPQSGRGFTSRVRGKNSTEVEQDSANIGPLSSALIKVRDASNLFVNVPLLSSYASSVSWFSDLGASAAKIFGWRKPISLAPSTRVTQNFLPYAANNDGPDFSFPLSLSYENSVGMANGFSGTNVDEMDFSFLCTIPVWITTLNVSTSLVTGSIVANLLVSPVADVFSVTVNSTIVNHYSPLQLVARQFSFWRGSIVYKFKIVKTEFHSGRISVSFAPRAQSTTPSISYGNTQYIHREILDLRESSEFTFVVPYVSEAPYLDLDAAQNIGNLYVYVVDPIVAPATVTQSISIIVEKCAGPDIEFATPDSFFSTYYTGFTPQAGESFSSIDQGSTVCSNQNATIGSSLVCGDSGINALQCIGERISSVRSLVKLPSQLITTSPLTANNYLNVAPFAISTGTIVGATNTLPSVVGDLYAVFASCYLYSRGGVRLKYVDNVPVTATQPALVTLFLNVPTITSINTNTINSTSVALNGQVYNTIRSNMPVMYYRSGYSGEVQIPQYHRYRSRVNIDCVANATNPYKTVNSLAPRIYVSRSNLPDVVSDSQVLRSGADDLNFGCFTSVPPMVANLPF